MSTFPARDRSYFNYYSIGFLTNVLRGYDLRIIEASSYVMQRNEFKHQLFARKYNVSKVMPLRQFQTFPIAIYGKVYFDQGYAVGYPDYDGSDLLTDQYLYSFGAGLDLVLVNDITFRLELSRTAEDQTHFFINLLSLFLIKVFPGFFSSLFDSDTTVQSFHLFSNFLRIEFPRRIHSSTSTNHLPDHQSAFPAG